MVLPKEREYDKKWMKNYIFTFLSTLEGVELPKQPSLKTFGNATEDQCLFTLTKQEVSTLPALLKVKCPKMAENVNFYVFEYI